VTTQTQKNADTHPCLELDSKTRSQCSSGRRQLCLRPRGHWDRPSNINKTFKYNFPRNILFNRTCFISFWRHQNLMSCCLLPEVHKLTRSCDTGDKTKQTTKWSTCSFTRTLALLSLVNSGELSGKRIKPRIWSCRLFYVNCRRYTSSGVSIVTRLRDGLLGFNSWQGQWWDFSLFTNASRPALGSTHHYAVFSTIRPPHFQIQISSTNCSQKPSVYALPSKWETKFRTPTVQLAKLQFSTS
jgi:hypothetical protein